MNAVDTSLSNSQYLDEQRKQFFADVREYGRDSALGKDALPKLCLRVIQAAYDTLIDTQKIKGQTVDDATRIYEDYIKSESNKSVHTEGGVTANASKLRQCILFGMIQQFDPIPVIERTVDIHKNMRAADLPVKSAYAAYVDVCRAQLAKIKAGDVTPLTDGEITAAMETVKKDKDETDHLKAALKELEKAHGLNSRQETKEIAAQITTLLTYCTTAIVRAEKEAQLRQLQEELQAAE